MAYWLIGREIVEEEQKGSRRADYGEGLLRALAAQLQADFGRGFSHGNLKAIRQLYVTYPEFLSAVSATPIGHAVRGQSGRSEKGHAVRGLSRRSGKGDALRSLSSLVPIGDRPADWEPGRLHPNLSWTHYRVLMRVDRPEPRAFYEIETLRHNWSARELERQASSLLYERLARSRDKAGLLRLATEGQVVAEPADVFKDPMVIEFLGLPESPRLVESKLEDALITNLQEFLLELGKGFAFVARQRRLTLDGDHFYVDLVFYHVVLKCYVLVDLKVGKLTHADLGQLQLYVNYYDRELRTPGDNPTLGLILCPDKNDAVVRYTLGAEQAQKIFASRYKLHLPTEAELAAEIRREVRALTTVPIRPARERKKR
jgi:predicted nuclease of restriction endonuclease-like (RecB) superfamily